jgi:mannitol-specific phosphotransferase system IIBC component
MTCSTTDCSHRHRRGIFAYIGGLPGDLPTILLQSPPSLRAVAFIVSALLLSFGRNQSGGLRPSRAAGEVGALANRTSQRRHPSLTPSGNAREKSPGKRLSMDQASKLIVACDAGMELAA